MKGPSDYLALGDWNAVCYECGSKHKASELIKHWQGYYVCRRCWEPRHPQDFVRAVADKPAAPWAQSPADLAVIGDFLITESSDTLLGPLIYITTETLIPITTET